MENNTTCPICSKPTFLVYGKYPRKDGLCKECSQKLFNKEIEQCPDCQKWNNTGNTCDCKKTTAKTAIVKELPKENILTGDTACIICGEPSNGKPQCKNCYYETKDFMEVLDKNSTVRKTRDHYYNLKERILIIKTLEETKKQCNKLIAIAMIAETFNNDTSLIDRVYNDVEALIKNKQPKIQTPEIEEEKKEQDENKTKINTSEDGHNVDSDMEVRIDDVLYHSRIIHVYGKNVDEILEKRKKSDWFIPIVNDQGIYIEYWGMKTKKYLEDRKEKEELYKKYNVPYIGIEADDPKQDTQTFKANLIREITKLAIDRYEFMPRWIKPEKKTP